ncbi:hypothetical protein B0H13DRAFT_2079391, partial [Mycena leptocephala]
MRAFVEARGGEEDAGRRMEERVRVWGRMVGEVVDAYVYPGSGVAAVVHSAVYRHPGPASEVRPFSLFLPLPPLVPLTHLLQLLRRCDISKQTQLPRRCVLPRPAPVLSIFLSIYLSFFLFSLLHLYLWPLVAGGVAGSRVVAGFCCYIAGRSSVWSDVRLCTPRECVRPRQCGCGWLLRADGDPEASHD